MPASILQGQHHRLVIGEVVLGEFYAPIQDADQVFGFELLRCWRVGPVAFEAQRIWFLGAQQVVVVAAVGLMAGRASLLKSRLMEMRLLKLVGLVGMASQTGADRIRLQEARGFAGVWVVASHAFSLGSGMRHLRLIDLLHLIAVTSGAERSRVGVGQNNFAVLRGRVADLAGLVGKWRMRKFLQQLRLRGLVRIVALRTSGRSKGLPLVSLDERGILDVVAVDAERGDGLSQVIVEFLFPLFANFVRDVAGVASHVEGGVAAAFFGDVQTLIVAIETEVLALLSRRGFQQLILVFGNMRVV